MVNISLLLKPITKVVALLLCIISCYISVQAFNSDLFIGNRNPVVSDFSYTTAGSLEDFGNPRKSTTAEDQILRLEFGVSSGASRSFVIGFSESATEGFDYGLDGGLITDPPADDMGSLLNGQQYVIQALPPYTSETVVDLVLHASGNFNYTLRSTEITNFPADQDIYLRDNLTDTYYDLRNSEPYNFTSEAGTFTDRFKVIFQNPSTLSNEEFQADNTIIYVNQVEDRLYVRNLMHQTEHLNIINMLGQSVMSFNNVDNQALENGLNISRLNSGVYIVNLLLENNRTMEKKIIIN